MVQTVRAAPEYSLLVIADPSTSDPPEPIWGQHIHSTSSCVTIGVYSCQHGETTITLGLANEILAVGAPVFEQVMDTPSREVAAMDPYWIEILKQQVPTTRTRLRIWENHPKTPDRVMIALG